MTASPVDKDGYVTYPELLRILGQWKDDIVRELDQLRQDLRLHNDQHDKSSASKVQKVLAWSSVGLSALTAIGVAIEVYTKWHP